MQHEVTPPEGGVDSEVQLVGNKQEGGHFQERRQRNGEVVEGQECSEGRWPPRGTRL